MSTERRSANERRKFDPDSDLGRVIEGAVGSALDRRHRQILTEAATIAVLIVLIVALPVTLVLNHNQRAGARRLTVVSCQLQAAVRPQSNARAFAQRITLQVADDVVRHLPPAQRRREEATIQRAARAEAPFAPGQHLERVHSFSQLARVVRDLPLLDCAKSIP